MSSPISSRWTPFYKFVVPLLVVGAAGSGVYSVWLHPDRHNIPSGTPPLIVEAFVILLFAVAIVLMWRMLLPLKTVELSDDELIISNYRAEIRVLLANVEAIRGPSLTNPKRYTLVFEEATEFGRRVPFLAPLQLGVMRFAEPAAIVELRSAWERSRAADRRPR